MKSNLSRFVTAVALIAALFVPTVRSAKAETGPSTRPPIPAPSCIILVTPTYTLYSDGTIVYSDGTIKYPDGSYSHL